jgi:hypothetical protein
MLLFTAVSQCSAMNRHLAAFTATENNSEISHGNSVLPIHVLFSCFMTDISIFIPIYLLDSVRYVSYNFNFLFAVEKTLA